MLLHVTSVRKQAKIAMLAVDITYSTFGHYQCNIEFEILNKIVNYTTEDSSIDVIIFSIFPLTMYCISSTEHALLSNLRNMCSINVRSRLCTLHTILSSFEVTKERLSKVMGNSTLFTEITLWQCRVQWVEMSERKCWRVLELHLKYVCFQPWKSSKYCLKLLEKTFNVWTMEQPNKNRPTYPEGASNIRGVRLLFPSFHSFIKNPFSQSESSSYGYLQHWLIAMENCIARYLFS